MAKQEIKYVCDICGKKHTTLPFAEECESTHFVPTSFKDFSYDLSDKERYPLDITVRLKNKKGQEKIIIYYRKK